MGNCCRIIVSEPIDSVIKIAGEIPAVKIFGGQPIRSTNDSYFGKIPSDLLNKTEINFINNVKEVINVLHANGVDEVIWQDLDGYGSDRFFIHYNIKF